MYVYVYGAALVFQSRNFYHPIGTVYIFYAMLFTDSEMHLDRGPRSARVTYR